MKKHKTLKIILASILAVSILTFCIDLYRVSNYDMPIFSYGFIEIDSGGRGNYLGLLYHFNVELDLDVNAVNPIYVSSYKAYYLGIKVADVNNKVQKITHRSE